MWLVTATAASVHVIRTGCSNRVSRQVRGARAVSLMCALKMEGSAPTDGNRESRKPVKVKCMNLESEWCFPDSSLLQRSVRLTEADRPPWKGIPWSMSSRYNSAAGVPEQVNL